jgi:hypothetical protein
MMGSALLALKKNPDGFILRRKPLIWIFDKKTRWKAIPFRLPAW